MLNRTKWIAFLAVIATVGSLQAQEIKDVSLAAGGRLNGRIVSSDGQALANEVVTVANSSGDQVRVKTDGQGQFGVKGLPGGTFSVSSRYGTQWIRGWAEGTAPRNARSELVVVGSPVVAASSSAVQPAGHFGSSCDNGCDSACDSGCAVGGAGLVANRARFIAGAALIGLGVWGIVELADDDAAAS